MRIEKAELLLSDLRFESKAQSHQSYEALVRETLDISGISARMLMMGVRKALDCL